MPHNVWRHAKARTCTIRLSVAESPAFRAHQAAARAASATPKLPILEVVRTYPKQILLAMGARFAENVSFYIFTVFILTYATTQLKLTKGVILTGLVIASAVESAETGRWVDCRLTV